MAKSRTIKSNLIRLLQQSSMPVYVVSSNMKIAFCNSATCRWTGQDEETLTKLICIYTSATDLQPSQQTASGLCPPPESFRGKMIEGYVHTTPAGSKTEFRKATFYPLNDASHAAGSTEAVLVIVHGASVGIPSGDSPSRGKADAHSLHIAITQMLHESINQINLDLVVGSSSLSRRIRSQIDLAGACTANVLIVGPPGSGRRSIAELIHYAQGPQQAGPLIPIECSLSNAEIVQETVKELYRQFKNYPDEPLGRLLLLDVDQLPQAAQGELLGFLNLPDFQLPLVGTCQANRDGAVDDDLWRMLTTLTIELPRLTERREDIPFLAQAFLESHNSNTAEQFGGFDESALQQLLEYDWPGQIKELKDVVLAACQNGNPPTVVADDLPRYLHMAIRSQLDEPAEELVPIDLDKFLAEIESELIERAVQQTAGNKSQAARLLGISRARLLRRITNDDPSADGKSDETRGPNTDLGEPGQ